MIIKPYSTIAEEAFNPADYPACKLFIDFAETDAVYDRVTGNLVIADPSAVATLNGDSLYFDKIETGTQISGGLPTALSSSTGKYVLFMLTASVNANGDTAGGHMFGVSSDADPNAAASKIFVRPGTTGIVDIGANFGTAACVVTGGQTKCAAVGYVSGASATAQVEAYQSDTSTLTATTGNAAAASCGAANVLTYLNLMSDGDDALTPSLNRLYSVAIMEFASKPPAASIHAAIAWHRSNHTAGGNKTVYPGWRDLA